ncbi:SPOR domain-containing protein [Streptomyces sp. NPDC002073]
MAHRRTLAAALALCGALALTACDNGEDNAQPPAGPGAPGAGTATTAPATPGTPATASAKATPGPAKTPAKKPAPSAPKPAETKAPAPGATCDHKMPISPDEIAVYRYTPEGGFLSLIVKHGNWGCGTPDSDGAPFETIGVETFIPLDQAAHITVTNPIVTSTENQKIGVQEFLDWLEAHPNSGLVFKYHLGADAAIDTLDQVFTP